MVDQAKEDADALIKIVVFEVDGEEYAMPISEVREVVNSREITPVPNSAAYVMGVINLRGQVIPIVNLERRFGLRHDTKDKVAEHIIVVDVLDEPFGILVDVVSGVLEVEEGSMQSAPDAVQAKLSSGSVRGVYVFEGEEKEKEKIEKQERIILVLSLQNIFTVDETRQVKARSQKEGPKQKEKYFKPPKVKKS